MTGFSRLSAWPKDWYLCSKECYYHKKMWKWSPLPNSILKQFFALTSGFSQIRSIHIIIVCPHTVISLSLALPPGEGNSLAISQPIFNGSALLGVLHAILPFNQLLSMLNSALTGREFSYAFVLDQNSRQPLFHPLLPGDSLVEVSIADLEPEGVIGGVLDRWE